MNLLVESPKEFIEVILTNIYYLFGNNLPFELQISPLNVDPPENMPRFPFSYLFLSFCHSMGLPENDLLFNSLNTKSRKNPEYLCIDLTKLKYDFKYQPAILSTLKYAFNIRSLRISGETTPDSETIFQVLSQTIKNNSQCLHSLTLLNCATFTGFSDFCESILNSYLCKICFDGVVFKTKAFSLFVDILPQSAIEKIQFIRCPLKTKIINLIKVNASNFSKLRSISMNNTEFLKDKNNLKLFFDFLKEANISIIELVNDRIDIADVFYCLSQTEIPIISLNVSENYCSSKFSGQYILPVTLENIKLAGVNWSPTALFNLLTSQSYVNMVQLDISNQLEANSSFDGLASDSDGDVDSKLNEFALLEMHRALKPTGNMNINSLIWNYNMLSNGFFTYIAQLKYLEKLSIDCCLCDPNETTSIQNDLVLYLQNSNLKELSIKGPDSPYKSLLKGLFAVISAHQSLRALDVSDNEIGDEGLEMVVDCLSKNKNIERIAFDGSKLQKPQKFIDCCNRLSELENLKYIAEPTKDMENLKTQEELLKVTPGMVENAWERLKAKLNEKTKRMCGNEIDVEENDISDDGFNINLSRFNGNYFSSFASTAAIPIKQNVQKASWKIEINVPYDKESSTWEAMGEQFSLQTLTGIRPDNQDSLIFL